MKKTKKHKLGHWQISMLNSIFNKELCCHRSAVDLLIGRAKNWNRRYTQRLKSAVSYHNDGTATNSPIDSKWIIIEDKKRGYEIKLK